MVATGLLLSIAVLAASAQSWPVFSRKVTGQGRPQPQPSPAVAKEANQRAAGPPAHEADRQVADPVRLRIPAIGVDAPIDPLTVDNNRVLPPPNSNDAPAGGATARSPANGALR